MEIRKLSEIIFIPAYKSPLKLDVNSASSDNRFAMTKKAVEKYKNFSVSNYEIEKNDISYTINTIKHFKEKYDNIELIIGYDNFLIFDKWYKSDEILDLVDIVVLRRFYEEAVKPKVNSDKFIFVETPTIQISSTVIRDRIAKNLPIDFLVTPEIQNFIESKGLYKE
jgi:nicotinate-nucleotide adenylyltransferase